MGTYNRKKRRATKKRGSRAPKSAEILPKKQTAKAKRAAAERRAEARAEREAAELRAERAAARKAAAARARRAEARAEAARLAAKIERAAARKKEAARARRAEARAEAARHAAKAERTVARKKEAARARRAEAAKAEAAKRKRTSAKASKIARAEAKVQAAAATRKRKPGPRPPSPARKRALRALQRAEKRLAGTAIPLERSRSRREERAHELALEAYKRASKKARVSDASARARLGWVTRRRNAAARALGDLARSLIPERGAPRDLWALRRAHVTRDSAAFRRFREAAEDLDYDAQEAVDAWFSPEAE